MTIKFELSEAEFQQLEVDLEQVKLELEDLSDSVDWFVTSMPERLADWLTWMRQTKESQ